MGSDEHPCGISLPQSYNLNVHLVDHSQLTLYFFPYQNEIMT